MNLAALNFRMEQEDYNKLNDFIYDWRKHLVDNKVYDVFTDDYVKESYIVAPEIDRFGSGEAKCVIDTTVRGADIFHYQR